MVICKPWHEGNSSSRLSSPSSRKIPQPKKEREKLTIGKFARVGGRLGNPNTLQSIVIGLFSIFWTVICQNLILWIFVRDLGNLPKFENFQLFSAKFCPKMWKSSNFFEILVKIYIFNHFINKIFRKPLQRLGVPLQIPDKPFAWSNWFPDTRTVSTTSKNLIALID